MRTNGKNRRCLKRHLTSSTHRGCDHCTNIKTIIDTRAKTAKLETRSHMMVQMKSFSPCV